MTLVSTQEDDAATNSEQQIAPRQSLQGASSLTFSRAGASIAKTNSKYV